MKWSDNKKIIFMILTLILFFSLIKGIKIKEGLETTNNTVVLLGDSIFKNNEYVTDRFSIENRLQKKINTFVYAEDGAFIANIIPQYYEMPRDLNNNNTYIFVSIGGNNILEEYYYNDNPITDYQPLDNLWKEYKKTIENLRSLTKCNIVLTDIYYITDKNYTQLIPLLEKWNENLHKFCKKEKLMVYKISDIVERPQDFTNGIEPSIVGGQIIVDNIINY
jgi:hypothetical protein